MALRTLYIHVFLQVCVVPFLIALDTSTSWLLNYVTKYKNIF